MKLSLSRLRIGSEESMFYPPEEEDKKERRKGGKKRFSLTFFVICVHYWMNGMEQMDRLGLTRI